MYISSLDMTEEVSLVTSNVEIDPSSKAWSFGLTPITGVLSLVAASVAATAGAPVLLVVGAASVSVGFAAATGALIYDIIFD
jgi:hypothetical protein